MISEKYTNMLNKSFRILGNTSFLVLILVTFAQVLTRYLFSYSFSWADEFLKFCFAWMILLGMLTSRQIQVTLLRDHISRKWGWIFAEVCYLFVLFCLTILFIGGIQFFFLTRNDTYSAFKISISWFYLPLIITTTLELIRVVLTMIDGFIFKNIGEL